MFISMVRILNDTARDDFRRTSIFPWSRIASPAKPSGEPPGPDIAPIKPLVDGA
jgi:hypothetical protein